MGIFRTHHYIGRAYFFYPLTLNSFDIVLYKNDKGENPYGNSPLSQVCTNVTDSRTFVNDLSKIVEFIDWCKDSDISFSHI